MNPEHEEDPDTLTPDEMSEWARKRCEIHRQMFHDDEPEPKFPWKLFLLCAVIIGSAATAFILSFWL